MMARRLHCLMMQTNATILYITNHAQLKAIGLLTTYFPLDHARLANPVVPDALELAVKVTVYTFFSFFLINVSSFGSTLIFTARVFDTTDTLYVAGVRTLVKLLVYLTTVGALLPPPFPEAVCSGTAKDG